ncbi:hypothetical protein ABW20_dc0103850 [Dactylellina cionopaga]|nr:hypothetical protein ABW20_dc0103850 [Dactylellina cionopaga]
MTFEKRRNAKKLKVNITLVITVKRFSINPVPRSSYEANPPPFAPAKSSETKSSTEKRQSRQLCEACPRTQFEYSHCQACQEEIRQEKIREEIRQEEIRQEEIRQNNIRQEAIRQAEVSAINYQQSALLAVQSSNANIPISPNSYSTADPLAFPDHSKEITQFPPGSIPREGKLTPRPTEQPGSRPISPSVHTDLTTPESAHTQTLKQQAYQAYQAAKAQAEATVSNIFRPKTIEEKYDELQAKMKKLEKDHITKIRNLETERDHKIANLRSQRDRAEGKQDKAEENLAKVEKKYNDLYSNYSLVKKQRKELEAECEQHRSKLRSQKNEYELQIREMQKSVDDHRNHIGDIQTSLSSYNGLLADEHADSDWESKFGAFCGSVTTWATTVAPSFSKVIEKAPSRITPELEEEIRMVILTPNLSLDDTFRSLKGGKKRRYFVQGWAHLVMWKLVFAPNIPSKWASSKKGLPSPSTRPTGQDLWLDSRTAEAVKQLELEMANYYHNNEVAFHKWRCLTLSMLQKTSPTLDIHRSIESQIEKRCREMAEFLQELRDPTDQAGLEVAKLESGLLGLFKEAIKISSELRTQKAAFDVRFPTRELPVSELYAGKNSWNGVTQPVLSFDSHWMKADSRCTPVVQFVIEPALFKSGNGSGQDYGTAGPLLPATVACASNSQPPETPHLDQPPAYEGPDLNAGSTSNLINNTTANNEQTNGSKPPQHDPYNAFNFLQEGRMEFGSFL